MLYLILEIWSNSEDGTGSVPELFESVSKAREHYENKLDEALADFLDRGYCSADDIEDIKEYFVTGMNSDEEVETSGNLMYNFKDGTYDFWSSGDEYDFGYSIETHKMVLNK